MIKHKEAAFGEKIKYYCKDCNKIVGAKQVGRKYVFRCDICKTKNVAFGTEKSLINFFHIEEDDDKKEDKKKEEKKEGKKN